MRGKTKRHEESVIAKVVHGFGMSGTPIRCTDCTNYTESVNSEIENKERALLLLVVGFIGLVFGCSTVTKAAAPKSFSKVTIVVLENTRYSEAIKQPFMGKLIEEGALLTKYTAPTHPSQGNYIAMTAGSVYGVHHDDNVDLNVRHIGDLLEEKNKTWKVYAEDYPENCFLGARQGHYVRKHLPFLSFTNVSKNPSRCSKIVNSNHLEEDIRKGQIADYSYYVPNLKNDGHDTGVKYADQWLGKRFGALLKDPKFMEGMLFVVTFDEDDGVEGNRVATIFYGNSVTPGAISDQQYNHYSLLKTIEHILGLGSLGQHDQTAKVIDDVFIPVPFDK